MTSKLTPILNRVLLLRVYTKVQGMALFPGQDVMRHFVPYSTTFRLFRYHSTLHSIYLSSILSVVMVCGNGNGSNTTEWNDNGMEELMVMEWRS